LNFGPYFFFIGYTEFDKEIDVLPGFPCRRFEQAAAGKDKNRTVRTTRTETPMMI